MQLSLSGSLEDNESTGLIAGDLHHKMNQNEFASFPPNEITKKPIYSLTQTLLIYLSLD